jgi:hypothetical protein
MLRSLRIALLFLFIYFSPARTTAAIHHPGPYVPLCSRQIVFTASYLAYLHSGDGPGYLFRIENHTAKLIRLAEPVPSSAHWYARVGNKWLWRASSGSGGSYVDAINEHGPVFAYQPKTPPSDPKYITVPAHGSYEWTAGERENQALAYQPRCQRCNYPGESEYKAVFAYAYLPPSGGQHKEDKDLLPCGLRTKLVDMPPKPLVK